MSTSENLSDFEKIAKALSFVKFTSVDDVLTALGLANLPTAQRYGIVVGICVFTLTVMTVLMLLVFGGSFARMAEQSKSGVPTVPEPIQARKSRALLLERLLEARERMMKENATKDPDVLTKRLENVACKNVAIPDLVEEASKRPKSGGDRYIPPGYQENYANAYRKWQDKPGGPILSGRPEARYEAYARAYAGCGLNTTTTYRRSYARMYEALCCATHASDDKFRELFESRPHDIVGRFVRLEALEKERHLEDFYDATCGDMYMEHPEYDPSKVWGFLEYGPFDSEQEMAKSPLFEREVGKAAFAIIDNVTDRLIGMVMLANDDPKNLNIQMEPPIMKPKSIGAPEQLEACFLLMDRLFALGYRRLNMLMDSQDVETRKLPGRLGMTQEGLLPKHMIIKEASRDSAVYGMLNSDWDKGARGALFKKLYGNTSERVDSTYTARENEAEEQERKLKLLKAQEKEAAAKKKL